MSRGFSSPFLLVCCHVAIRGIILQVTFSGKGFSTNASRHFVRPWLWQILWISAKFHRNFGVNHVEWPDKDCCLVVWNTAFIFSIQLGISSSQLTNSIIFQRGRAQPPTRLENLRFIMIWPTDIVIEAAFHVISTSKSRIHVQNICLWVRSLFLFSAAVGS